MKLTETLVSLRMSPTHVSPLDFGMSPTHTVCPLNFGMSPTHAGCLHDLDTACDECSGHSKIESTEKSITLTSQSRGTTLLPSEHLQGCQLIATKKNLYSYSKASGTSFQPSSVVDAQKIIDMLKIKRVLPNRVSTKHLLGNSHPYGDMDMKTRLCNGYMLKTESDNLTHIYTGAHEKQPENCCTSIQDKYTSYLCAVCSKSFGSSSACIRHERRHTSDGAYKCPYCDKTFHQSWNLNVHKRTHTGEKPFTCLACGKTFTTSSNLVVHNRTHTGEKPYVCNVCGDAFRRIMHMNKHKRVHTAQRLYLCEVCGKSFRQKWTLNQHERTHSSEQPYMCHQCGQGFRQRAGYNQHNKRHHATVLD